MEVYPDSPERSWEREIGIQVFRVCYEKPVTSERAIPPGLEPVRKGWNLESDKVRDTAGSSYLMIKKWRKIPWWLEETATDSFQSGQILTLVALGDTFT